MFSALPLNADVIVAIRISQKGEKATFMTRAELQRVSPRHCARLGRQSKRQRDELYAAATTSQQHPGMG